MTSDKRARQKANRASRVAAAEAAEARARMRSRFLTYGGIALVIVVAIIGIAVLTSDDDEPTTSADPGATTSGPEPTTEPPPSTEPPPPTEPPSDSVPAADECPAEDGSSPRVISFAGPPPMCIDPIASYTAVFATSEGEIRVALDTENTPDTVNNFVTLARWGYYDGTTIFRTDPSIEIIQGGAPSNSASDPGPGYTIPDEPTFQTDPETGQLTGPYRYEPGQLVMARSFGPDSSGAQYFFVTGPNAAGLDGQGTYIVFGETDATGLEVLETIIGLHVDDPASGLGGFPSRTVVVESVTIEQG